MIIDNQYLNNCRESLRGKSKAELDNIERELKRDIINTLKKIARQENGTSNNQ